MKKIIVFVLLAISCGFIFGFGVGKSTHRKQWEFAVLYLNYGSTGYNIFYGPPKPISGKSEKDFCQKFGQSSEKEPKVLNAIGNDGWELISIQEEVYWFKRPK